MPDAAPHCNIFKLLQGITERLLDQFRVTASVWPMDVVHVDVAEGRLGCQWCGVDNSFSEDMPETAQQCSFFQFLKMGLQQSTIKPPL